MKHIFKVSFEFADLIVHAIDLEKGTITCQTIEKDTGKSLTNLSEDKYAVVNGLVVFPCGKLPIKLLQHIHEILTS